MATHPYSHYRLFVFHLRQYQIPNKRLYMGAGQDNQHLDFSKHVDILDYYLV